MRGSTIVAVMGVLTGALFFGGSAEAQRVRPAEVERLLASEDRAEVQQGIETIGMSGNPRFVPLLAERINAAMTEVERKAWQALAGYKFWMFGYHAAAWVKFKHLLGVPRPNPFVFLVQAARSNLNNPPWERSK